MTDAGDASEGALEDELRATSERLRATLNAVSEGITVQEPDGRVAWANEAAARILRFSSPEQLLTTPLDEVMARFEVLDQDGNPLSLAELPARRALSGEEPPELLLRWRERATGTELWTLVRARPVLDGGGRVRFAVNVFRDVTLHQGAVEALRRSEERFAFLASASPVLLGSSLGSEALAARLAELAVPALAEWCSVWQLDAAGRATCLASRLARLPPDASDHAHPLADHPLWETLRQGRAVLVEDGVVAPLPELAPRSLLAVPIHERGAVVGALLLASTTAGRYQHADVAFAEDLAGRAGQGLAIARAYEAEQRAREEAEAATARLVLLSDLSRALAATLDVDQLLRALGRTLVPRFADQCVIDLVDADGGIRRVAVVGHDADGDADARLEAFAPDPANLAHPVVRALGGETTFLPDVGDEIIRTVIADESHRSLVRNLGPTSAIVVPVTGRHGPLGAVGFASVRASGRRLHDDDVALAEEIGRRAGVAIENARLFSDRSEAAATLSQALLPTSLPSVPGVDLSARYSPAAGRVGGDFYDVVALSHGRWLLVVADVCGKGADAASLTAMARYTLRALAPHHNRPAALLSAANEVMATQLPEGRFCTAAAAVLAPGPDTATLVVALAGHPGPLVVRASGEVVAVGRTAMPLGVVDHLDLDEDEQVLSPADAIVLFTDGCVGEGRDALRVLGATLEASAGRPAAALAAAVEAEAVRVEPDHPDDVAVLAVRFAGGGKATSAPPIPH